MALERLYAPSGLARGENYNQKRMRVRPSPGMLPWVSTINVALDQIPPQFADGIPQALSILFECPRLNISPQKYQNRSFETFDTTRVTVNGQEHSPYLLS